MNQKPNRVLVGERTQSSAIPRGNISDRLVPRLTAAAHEYGTAFFDKIDVDRDVQFRLLQADDLDECRKLHAEWFPIAYDEGFYRYAWCNGSFNKLRSQLVTTTA